MADTFDRSATNYTNQLLIAMPQMADSNFVQTVTYICDHTDQGAMGITLNRPLEINQHDLFSHLEINDIEPGCTAKLVYCGGPVQAERGFVLHTGNQLWKNTVAVGSDISITTSQDILDDVAHGVGPEQHIIALGYAGWGAQQLEHEVAANAWLTVAADIEVIFNTPAQQRWEMAAKTLGFDISHLSTDTGHA